MSATRPSVGTEKGFWGGKVEQILHCKKLANKAT